MYCCTSWLQITNTWKHIFGYLFFSMMASFTLTPIFLLMFGLPPFNKSFCCFVLSNFSFFFLINHFNVNRFERHLIPQIRHFFGYKQNYNIIVLANDILFKFIIQFVVLAIKVRLLCEAHCPSKVRPLGFKVCKT